MFCANMVQADCLDAGMQTYTSVCDTGPKTRHDRALGASKRSALQNAARNLALMMRRLLENGTPRRLAGAAPALCARGSVFWGSWKLCERLSIGKWRPPWHSTPTRLVATRQLAAA